MRPVIIRVAAKMLVICACLQLGGICFLVYFQLLPYRITPTEYYWILLGLWTCRLILFAAIPLSLTAVSLVLTHPHLRKGRRDAIWIGIAVVVAVGFSYLSLGVRPIATTGSTNQCVNNQRRIDQWNTEHSEWTNPARIGEPLPAVRELRLKCPAGGTYCTSNGHAVCTIRSHSVR